MKLILIYLWIQMLCFLVDGRQNKKENSLIKLKLDDDESGGFLDRFNFRFDESRDGPMGDQLRKIALAARRERIENEMRMEQEKREKIFRQYLANRQNASFHRDFLTTRY